MRRGMICMCLLLCAGTKVLAVTEADVTRQEAVVSAEHATLDSLRSLRVAEAVEIDSMLYAAKVRVLVVTPAPATDLRDPQYVDIDVPYSTWDALTQREWAQELREGPKHIVASVGRYSLRKDRAPAFLAMLKTFLTRDIAEVR